MATTALKGKKTILEHKYVLLETRICFRRDTHTLVDKDDTEWSDDQNNIRAEEACRAHKTGKIKNMGGSGGGLHTKKRAWRAEMTITDFHFYFFFSDTSLCHLFWEKSFSNFFFHFSKLFLSPSEQNMDATISHKGPEKKKKTTENMERTFTVTTN